MADTQKTQKQMYEYIKTLVDDAEVIDFCDKKITQLENRKSSPRKPSQEVLDRREAVLNFLQGVETATVADIAAALDFTSPQVTGAIRGLGDKVEVIESEKKSAPKSYKIAEL